VLRALRRWGRPDTGRPATSVSPPRSAALGDGRVEDRLRGLWAGALGVASVDPGDSFFDLGGTSTQALHLVADISRTFAAVLPPSSLLEGPTPASMAALLRRGPEGAVTGTLLLRDGVGRPVFVIPGAAGDPIDLHALVAGLDTERPVVGVRARGLDPRQPVHTRVEGLAGYYLDNVRRQQPAGPYALVGYSFGGLVAFEMASRLRSTGEVIELLALIDAGVPHAALQRLLPAAVVGLVHRALPFAAAPVLRTKRLARRLAGRLMARRQPKSGPTGSSRRSGVPAPVGRVIAASWTAIGAYRVRNYDGAALLILASVRSAGSADPASRWSRVIAGGVQTHVIDGTHTAILRQPTVQEVARVLSERLQAGQ
jgi:acetoacetyl-CoA synthetase